MCSILKKQPCLASSHCSWIVGKGCKKADADSGAATASPKSAAKSKMATSSPKPAAKAATHSKKAASSPPKPLAKSTKSQNANASSKLAKVASPKSSPKSPMPSPKLAKPASPKPKSSPKSPLPSSPKLAKVASPKTSKSSSKSPMPSSPKASPNPAHNLPIPSNQWKPGYYGYRMGDDNFWYEVGYSPSSRAKCHGCGEKIQKGELRFGRHQLSPFGDSDLIKYLHFEHAFTEFAKARCSSVPVSWDKLNGTQGLSDKDKMRVFEKIHDFGVFWARRCKDAPKKAKVAAAP